MKTSLDPNTWAVVAKLGINVESFKESITYICPYLDQKFYWCIPYAIVGEDLTSIRKAALKVFGKWQVDYAMDKQFFDEVSGNTPVEKWRLGSVTELFLGSGYTHGTIISDGDNGRARAKLYVNNITWIMVELWEWYNK